MSLLLPTQYRWVASGHLYQDTLIMELIATIAVSLAFFAFIVGLIPAAVVGPAAVFGFTFCLGRVAPDWHSNKRDDQ